MKNARLIISSTIAASALYNLSSIGLSAQEAGGLFGSENMSLDGAQIVRNTGWGEFADPRIFAAFLSDVIASIILTAVIVYHPVSSKRYTDLDRVELPKTFFLYGLLAMVIGFLVIAHGPMIGFVIFGIGGLMRFKTDLLLPGRTAECIVVTIVGLCLGLNLPAAAVLTTLSAWLILWFLGRKHSFTVEIMALTIDEMNIGNQDVRACAGAKGWVVGGEKHSSFKPRMKLAVLVPNETTRDDIISALHKHSSIEGPEFKLHVGD